MQGGRLTPGRLYVGTSGFAYQGWQASFYPASTRPAAMLAHYASILPAVELNSTWYRAPGEGAIRGWLAATPPGFRFAVKGQRGASLRALRGDPRQAVDRLTAPLRAFGERLGCVLLRVPADVERSDEQLAGLLMAWPRDIPMAVEFQHPSWIVDEVLTMLRLQAAALCATELPEDAEPPRLFLTGSFLYLRLRRHDYSAAELEAWAARVVPFLEAGNDVYAFFRHDEHGEAPLRAERLRSAVARNLGQAGARS